jgi:hypothetical protein
VQNDIDVVGVVERLSRPVEVRIARRFAVRPARPRSVRK